MASVFATKRLQRELPKLQASTSPGITLVSAPDFKEWLIDIQIMDPNHPIYAGKVYRLRFRFSQNYPIEAPEVMFTQVAANSCKDGKPRTIPMHPHIYSNGIICLDLLDKAGWSPVHNVESVSMSLQSMLAGNNKDERPEGDELFVMTNKRRPRDVNFEFHDDTC